jgi:hypothetical protein
MPRPSKRSSRGQRSFSLAELLMIEQGYHDKVPVREMAEKVGSTFKSIYQRYERFEAGETVLTPELVKAVSRLMGVRTLPDRHYKSDFELPAGTTGL